MVSALALLLLNQFAVDPLLAKKAQLEDEKGIANGRLQNALTIVKRSENQRADKLRGKAVIRQRGEKAWEDGRSIPQGARASLRVRS